jgi:hypothetical protein
MSLLIGLATSNLPFFNLANTIVPYIARIISLLSFNVTF